jgi:hypothetical protein
MKVTRFIIASAFFFDSIHCQADQAQETFLDLLSRLSGREIVTKLDFDDELKVKMRAYGWRVAAEGSLNPKVCWLTLTLLGDLQARPLVVTEITKDPTSSLGAELAASGVPTLLLDLAPVMFRKERWENLGKGSDAEVLSCVVRNGGIDRDAARTLPLFECRSDQLGAALRGSP